jgi:hypothetical protein
MLNSLTISQLYGLGDLTVNNPGNLEKSTGQMWQGEYTCSRTRFACFESMPYGYRAMFLNLRNYITQHNADTIAKMISRWAPPVENQTDIYIRNVEAWTGINRNTRINPNDVVSLKKIVSAISRMENGFQAVQRDIDAGYELAKSRFGEYVKKGAGLLGVIGAGVVLYLIFKKQEA